MIKPSSFGDVIHALPVLNGLRHRYPTARISWLVAESLTGLLTDHPALDEVIPFDRKRYGAIGRKLDVSMSFMEFIYQLRARRFDLVLDLQGLFRSGFLAFSSGAPTRIGFANAREFGWMFYTDRVAIRDQEMHAVDRNYLFARSLGFDDVPVEFKLPVTDAARVRARQMLSHSDSAYALIAPGTRWETKQWSAAGFAEVARRLANEQGLRIVLIGMPDERTIADDVASRCGVDVINLAGETQLDTLIALVDGAAVCVMHDSGPMHLATALGKPMVALYGPTNPQRTGPYRRDDAILRLPLDCSPCYIKKVADCPHVHRCMKDLTPQAVHERAATVISTGAQTH